MTSKNVTKLIGALTGGERSELANALLAQAQPKTASTKARVEYEYKRVYIGVEVRAKGSKGDYQPREIDCNPLAKPSLNNFIFAPAADGGVLISRKGIYLPKANFTVESRKS